MANDFSIDLETLSNKYNAPILSIGIVGFNRDTGKIGPKLYVEVDPDDAMRYGVPTASTIAWWVNQSNKAKQVFDTKKNKLPLYNALQSVCDFLHGNGKGVPTVWGNGSSFDITVLEHALDLAGRGLAAPWTYWNIRDMRTAVDMARVDPRDYTKTGTHHNALDDAEFQAMVIADCFARIAKAFGPAKKAAVVPTVEDDEL